MKYAFFGSPRFAALVLDGLMARGLAPAVVVTNPDRPAGRKREIKAPPAKSTSLSGGIPVLQPEEPAELEERELLELIGVPPNHRLACQATAAAADLL